jgi:hypothetical protein
VLAIFGENFVFMREQCQELKNKNERFITGGYEKSGRYDFVPYQFALYSGADWFMKGN